MRKKSQRRLEMGEEKWSEYQRFRTSAKAKRHYYRKTEQHNLNVTYLSSWRLRAKLDLIQYKGGKCSICGYNKMVPRAYDFHHRNPLDKEFSIGQFSIHNFEKMKKEVDKCDLLCRNCHAEVHNDSSRIEALMDAHRKVMDMRMVLKSCVFCGNEFKPKKSHQKYCCKVCKDGAASTASLKPTKEQLIIDLKDCNYSMIGRKYGVSDNAVRKWIKKYQIEVVKFQ